MSSVTNKLHPAAADSVAKIPDTSETSQKSTEGSQATSLDNVG